MKNHGKHLGRSVKEARLMKSMTQDELGYQLGVNGQLISNLERGHSSVNLKHVIKISKILEVPLEALKRAMVRDYEDTINTEVWAIIDRAYPRPGSGDKLRETGQGCERVLPKPQLHGPTMSSGSSSGLSRSVAQ